MEWKFKKGCKGQKENKEAIKSSQKRVLHLRMITYSIVMRSEVIQMRSDNVFLQGEKIESNLNLSLFSQIGF